MTDRFILKPFNGVFFAVFLLFAALLVGSTFWLRKKDLRFRGVVLAAFMAVIFVYFWVYKALLAQDLAYSEICAAAGKGGFSWWEELPFHLCNINMMLLPVAALTRWRPLCSFCFFLAPLGAFMALVMPGVGFDAYSVFLPRMLGYFITHFAIFFGGVALAAYGLYRPRFHDFPGTLLTTMGIALFSFTVSELIRFNHLSDHANYFDSVESEGNAILALFYRIIPVPYIYLWLSIVILLPYMSLVTVGFWLYDRRHPVSAAA